MTEKKREILVRDIPENIYNTIVKIQAQALLEGKRISLGAIALDFMQKGMNADNINLNQPN